MPTFQPANQSRSPWRAIRLRDLVLVFIGGGVGTLLRWSLDVWLGGGTQTLPATVTVNILGSFLVAFIPALLPANVSLRTLVVPGVIGGFTTYSTFSVEVARLIDSGNTLLGAGYAFGLVVVGLIAAGLGWWAASRVRARRAGASAADAKAGDR